MSMQVSGEIIKALRLKRNWTQEHLAHLLDRSVRTVQRVEKSGICDLETRAALAAVFEVDATQLAGDKTIEQAKNSNGEQPPLFYRRLESGQDIVSTFTDTMAYRMNNEEPVSSEDAEYMAHVLSTIQEWSEFWSDLDAGEQVRQAYQFSEMLKEMHDRGLCLFGLRTKSKTSFSCATGDKQTVDLKIANFFIAYEKSDAIIKLQPRGISN